MTPVTNDNSVLNLNSSTSNTSNLIVADEQLNVDSEQNQLVNIVSKQDNELSLTDEGRALLAVLAEIDESDKTNDLDMADKVESFTYGAFGMEHPDDVKEVADSSYSAGQYLKGALSIGAMLLAIV